MFSQKFLKSDIIRNKSNEQIFLHPLGVRNHINVFTERGVIVMDKEYINLKVQEIKNDIDLLHNKHIHELEKVPGTAKCSTLAKRMLENLNCVVDGYEELITNQIASAEREQFYLLSGMLTQLASEIAALSKKQPDGLVNAFKVSQINRVLRPLKEIMKDEPSMEFLDLVIEPDPEAKVDKSRNTYSDTALILSQFREACDKYRSKHYTSNRHTHL